MKKELLDKIYRQIIECEDKITKMDLDIDMLEDTKIILCRKKELEQNIAFCYELIDIIVEK